MLKDSCGRRRTYMLKDSNGRREDTHVTGQLLKNNACSMLKYSYGRKED